MLKKKKPLNVNLEKMNEINKAILFAMFGFLLLSCLVVSIILIATFENDQIFQIIQNYCEEDKNQANLITSVILFDENIQTVEKDSEAVIVKKTSKCPITKENLV